MTEHPFKKLLGTIKRRMKEADDKLSFTEMLYDAGKVEYAYDEALRLADRLERAVIYAREPPACTGNRYARDDIMRVMADAIPVEIGYTEQGWFSMRIPALLPKKQAGSSDYVRQFLYPAMQRFVSDKDITRFRKAVLIFRHVYPADRPERLMRDHDNFEVNAVADIVAVYMLYYDSPKYCNHYYCSAKGNALRTEVYVVPQDEYFDWFECEKTMPEEGMKLYDTIGDGGEA